MDKVTEILRRIPHFYQKEPDTNIYNVVNAFAVEFETVDDEYLQRADNALGVMTTDARDLGWRWGSFLGVPRTINETDNGYRMRLVNTINSLHGGTAQAIQYAVGLIMGVTNDQAKMDRQIKIWDAWEYPDAPDDIKKPGNFVIVIKFDNDDDISDQYYDGIEDDILAIVSSVKAAGTNGIVMFGYTVHLTLTPYHHHELSVLTHDDIRWRFSALAPHRDATGIYDSNSREMLDVNGIKMIIPQPSPLQNSLISSDNHRLLDKDGTVILTND